MSVDALEPGVPVRRARRRLPIDGDAWLGLVLLGVVLHNGTGLLGGYWGGRMLGFEESVCRTLALEVGMQNSGLAAALGLKYFSPLAALPGAIFSVWHNLSGSLLAGYWAARPPVAGSEPSPAPALAK